ncbi:hypothetical protein M0R04_15165 [Candidatus Dojkabacteria bacterium]|jgi:hypothetical protein|nr:hypothetical protein [Candidatus Dojkabacteria bacterium]
MKEILMKMLFQLLMIIMGLIPTELFLVIWQLCEMSGRGFWPQLAVVALGVFLLGAIQIYFIIGLITFTIVLWEAD